MNKKYSMAEISENEDKDVQEHVETTLKGQENIKPAAIN